MSGFAGTVSEMDAELGKLMRLKSTVEAASEIRAEATSATSLTEAYQRLRTHAVSIANEYDLEEEFRALFPEIEAAPIAPEHQRDAIRLRWRSEAEVAAHRAAALLQSLAGWLDGLLVSQRAGSK